MLYMARSTYIPQSFYSVKTPRLVQPVVKKSLLVDQIGCLGIPFHRLSLQLVLLRPVLVHVKGLRLQYGMGPFHDGREDAVQRTQNECRKEHDTKPQGERTQKWKDIHRLGTGQSLPYTIRHIESAPKPARPLATPVIFEQSGIISTYRFCKI